ncbi:2-dehydropantoate 2-reductase [Cytobacillus sp. FJAT-54145]|uniref:2-dehydropantoate 2-reductase n=1 Tax=Cytobacillus spartinae TaxID=3299023 RepID=A0ABW6KKA6_9BACI
MKISIIGGGSVGLLFAYYLHPFHEVVLYTRTRTQMENLQDEGLTLKKDNVSHRTKIVCKHIHDFRQNQEELTIITVKQYQLESLLKTITLTETAPILFLQNGMGHLKWLETLNANHIFVGSVEHGAYRENDVTVHHTGEGITRLANYKGDKSKLIHFIEPLGTEFPFKLEENYEEMLIRKLVVNAVINPLTAILYVENGQLVENPYFAHLLNSLFKEITGILELEAEKTYENLIHICKKTAHNRSSMLKDIEANRPTEIDAILGYLLEKAEHKKIEAPLTEAYYHCIKGKELRREGN